jgi:hypothetical protein
VHPAGHLDQSLGAFFAALDARRDYAVVLSADHGGIDLPERLREQGLPEAQRAAKELSGATIGKAIAEELGITPPAPGCRRKRRIAGVIRRAFWRLLDQPDLPPEIHDKVVASLIARLKANPQVAAVFTAHRSPPRPMPIGHPQDGRCSSGARLLRSGTLGRGLFGAEARGGGRGTPGRAMSPPMVRRGTMTGACRSCSGARAWPALNSPSR